MKRRVGYYGKKKRDRKVRREGIMGWKDECAVLVKKKKQKCETKRNVE